MSMNGEIRDGVREFKLPSRTKQSMAAETDINGIVKKFNQTGQLTHLAKHRGTYMDTPDQDADYHSCLTYVVQAQQAFQELPSHVRKRFHNDPGEFVDFASDEANHDELVEMGLARPRKAAQTANEGEGAPPPEPSENEPPAATGGDTAQ